MLMLAGLQCYWLPSMNFGIFKGKELRLFGQRTGSVDNVVSCWAVFLQHEALFHVSALASAWIELLLIYLFNGCLLPFNVLCAENKYNIYLSQN